MQLGVLVGAALRVLRGMQFGVLGFASLTAGWGACSFGCWWMLFCELDGWGWGHAVWAAGGCCFASWPGARGHAVWGAGGCCFASLTAGSRGHAVWGAGGCCFASLTAEARVDAGC